jgi:hypothetical protein
MNEELAAASQRPRPKVIYVMGAGHSGSTILGIALGNCADTFYAGEVEEWLVNGGNPNIGGSERTRFWQAVSREVDGAAALFGPQANRYLERSSAVFRIDRWLLRRRMRPGYRRVAEELLKAIARVAGVTYVVDSSHFPLRARELQRLEGIDLYLLFLVRDAQHVVASELRHISRHRVAERRVLGVVANARLWLTNLLSVLVFLRHPRERRLFVGHEEFLAAPQVALRQILDCVGSQAEIPDLHALRTGVPLNGNKVITSEVIALETPRASATRGSLITTIMHAPWKLVFSRLKPAL